MTARGPRDPAARRDAARNLRSVRADTWAARGSGYRPRRRGGSIRGVLFLLLLGGVVLGGVFFFAGPAFRDFALGMARDNPESLRLPFVSDVVKGHLGDKLTRPAGDEPEPVEFTVPPNATVGRIADDLTEAELIAEPLVFQYLVVTRDLDGRLQTGVFTLDRTMTPEEIVTRLQDPPDPPPARTTIALREGLRIEQVVAYLQTTDLTELDAEEFYALASDPPASLRADYDFLETLPEGRSLEGYLGSGVFEIDPDISAEDLLRRLLDDWGATLGGLAGQTSACLDLDFYQTLTLASIVERETGFAPERPLVAGVYCNRLRGLLNGNELLNADPTVIYANDTMQLRELEISAWPEFSFWGLIGVSSLNDFAVTEDLQGYQSYQTQGLPPGPIASPSLASLQAALAPNVADEFLFFVACPGEQEHRFAKTQRQHNANVAECRAQG